MSNNVPITDSAMVAERSVIGSILIDENTLDITREILKPSDFYAKYNQEIFSVMCHLQEVGKKVNTVSVYAELVSSKSFEEAGGISYLVECSNQLPNTNVVEHYAEIVKNEASRRKLSQFGDVIKALSSKPVDDLNSEISKLSDELLDICSENQVTPWQPFDKVLERACNALFDTSQHEIVPSGFVDLDEKITGFRPGELSIIAARPAMGKTALGLNILKNVAIDQSLPVTFFSLEMTSEELAYRLVSCMSSVNGNAIRQQKLSDEEWNRFLGAVEKYKSAHIIIDETPAITISTLSERAKRMQRQFGIKMIIVDYLQLMHSNSRNIQNREQEVADISKGLKALAKSLHVPVIALSQLNRAVDSRTVKQPVLSDIRESGSIEQDADKIIFIHREDYYNPNSQPTNEAEIIIAKQRNGPTGIVKLHWEGQYTRFSNLEHNDNYF
jgi:replicative DNA helicase